MDVEQPILSIPHKLLPVTSADHAPPSPDDELNEPKVNLFSNPYKSHFLARPESSSATRPSSGLADGSINLFSDPYKSHFLAKPETSSPTPSSSGSADPSINLFSNPYKSHFFAKPESSSSPPSGPADGSINLFGDPYKSHFFAKPGSSPATRPSSSLPPSGSADGSMDVEQPLPSIPEEPLPVSSPDHAPPSTGDGLNEMWLKLFGDPGDHFAKPESSSAARPSSRPTDGWTDVSQPLPTIPEEPSPVSSPDHAPPSTGDGLNEMWLKLFGHPEEPSPVPSPEHVPPSSGSLTESGNELMKGVTPPGPSDQALSTMSSADHELMDHALPNPGPSTESNHETMDVPLSSPVSLTNPDPQSMGADSPSAKRRKKGKGLWFATGD